MHTPTIRTCHVDRHELATAILRALDGADAVASLAAAGALLAPLDARTLPQNTRRTLDQLRDACAAPSRLAEHARPIAQLLALELRQLFLPRGRLLHAAR